MARLRVARSLKLFWSVVVAVVAVGAMWLQILGPIKSKPGIVPDPGIASAPSIVPAPVHRSSTDIPALNPALLTPSTANADWKIPHPGPHGTLPMRYYAAHVPVPDGRPQVAIMVGGIGEAEAPSLDAVKKLPPAVSLALTPYGAHVQAVAAAARKAGHETLMGLPMQTDREPDVTEGDQALRDGAPDADNQKNLDWVLSRAQGYAGVTDEIGMAVEETFLAHQMSAQWLGKKLHEDGLFLVVTSPGAAVPSGMKGRIADLIIDPGADEAQENAALKRLGMIALSKGSALGVLATPSPASIATLAKWCAGLKALGISLVPVSALAAPVEAQ